MKQEDKDLLLKDLCGRLPYGVKVSVGQENLQNFDNKWNNWSFDEEPQEIDTISIYGVAFGCMDMSDGFIDFEYIKPYLFPLSSMTEGQKVEHREEAMKYLRKSAAFFKAREQGENTTDKYIVDYEEIDWLNKNHFDYRGLIEKGLAIDATDKNIY